MSGFSLKKFFFSESPPQRPLQRQQEEGGEMAFLGVDGAIQQLQAATVALKRALEASGQRASPEQIASISACVTEAPELLALAKFDRRISEEARAIETQADAFPFDETIKTSDENGKENRANLRKKFALYESAVEKFKQAGDTEGLHGVEDKIGKFRSYLYNSSHGGKKSQSRRKLQNRKWSQSRRKK